MYIKTALGWRPLWKVGVVPGQNGTFDPMIGYHFKNDIGRGGAVVRRDFQQVIDNVNARFDNNRIAA